MTSALTSDRSDRFDPSGQAGRMGGRAVSVERATIGLESVGSSGYCRIVGCAVRRPVASARTSALGAAGSDGSREYAA